MRYTADGSFIEWKDGLVSTSVNVCNDHVARTIVDRLNAVEADNAALREAVRVLVKGIDAADLMASQTTSDGSAYPTIGEYIPEYAQARSAIDANPLAAAAVREAKEQA